MRTSVYYFPLLGTLLVDIKAWLRLCNKEGSASGKKAAWEKAAVKVAKGLVASPVDLEEVDVVEA